MGNGAAWQWLAGIDQPLILSCNSPALVQFAFIPAGFYGNKES
jgi:hypothetical protein